MKQISNLSLYCDSADLTKIKTFALDAHVSGFTTNPSICRAQGIENYREAISQILSLTEGKELSVEVISDDLSEMVRQGLEINKLGGNIFVKVPVINTRGTSTFPVVKSLLSEGVKVNVTAIFSTNQISEYLNDNLPGNAHIILSVFAGRLADIGQDPEKTLQEFSMLKSRISNNCRTLWASPREVFNIIQAGRSGCDIITLTPDLIEKAKKFGTSPESYSLDTVKMFYSDAVAANYEL
jgi:transaldolase